MTMWLSRQWFRQRLTNAIQWRAREVVTPLLRSEFLIVHQKLDDLSLRISQVEDEMTHTFNRIRDEVARHEDDLISVNLQLARVSSSLIDEIRSLEKLVEAIDATLEVSKLNE